MSLFRPPPSVGGFDRATLSDEQGRTAELSRADFENMPLALRVRAILSKRLRFYRGDKEITIKEALGDRY